MVARVDYAISVDLHAHSWGSGTISTISEITVTVSSVSKYDVSIFKVWNWTLFPSYLCGKCTVQLRMSGGATAGMTAAVVEMMMAKLGSES